MIRVQNKKLLQQQVIGGRAPDSGAITMLGLKEIEVRYIVSRVLRGLEQVRRWSHGSTGRRPRGPRSCIIERRA